MAMMLLIARHPMMRMNIETLNLKSAHLELTMGHGSHRVHWKAECIIENAQAGPVSTAICPSIGSGAIGYFLRPCSKVLTVAAYISRDLSSEVPLPQSNAEGLVGVPPFCGSISMLGC